MIGTLITRPSRSVTCIMLSSKCKVFARAVVGLNALRYLILLLSAKMFMPCLDKYHLVLAHNLLYLIQLMSLESIVCRQFYRIEPKFHLFFTGFHMNMRWLHALIAEEEKSITADSEYCRHELV